MSAQSKTQLLNSIHSTLKKRYKVEARGERLSVLEAVIFGLCHEGTTREQANQAMSRFKDQFFDWNEVRVSSIEEIAAVLVGSPDTQDRAERIRRFLRQLFEKTYGFALETLGKKPLKESTKLLQEYEALGSDYILATVIQRSLGGHAIPIDAPMHRALVRLGVIDEKTTEASVRSLLERAIPKNRGAEFTDLLEELAHDVCFAVDPNCPDCDLKKLCPFSQARLLALKNAEKAGSKAAKAKAAAKEKAALKAPAPPPKAPSKAAPPAAKGKAPKASAAKAKPVPPAKPAAPAKSKTKSPAPPTPKAKPKPKAAAPKAAKPKAAAKAPKRKK